MKSKITISFDYDKNEPYIKIQYSPSEDERDRMLKAFLEKMGSQVCFTKFSYEESSNPDFSIVGIRAIPFYNLDEEMKTMKAWMDYINKYKDSEITPPWINHIQNNL